MRQERVFDLNWIEFRALIDDHVVGPGFEEQIPLVIQSSKIAWIKPSVAEGLGGCCGNRLGRYSVLCSFLDLRLDVTLFHFASRVAWKFIKGENAYRRFAANQGAAMF
jgi:hypothetical protein